ncbi:hypothetical protein [uncultured Aquimarina sp.]|uniref:hypothetical protein n=1 Tax=uncultured Aquimarina sp. TaxID=575652 RepID=UPI0026291B7E|nr:hypothetical protein [uncultured Aquimarina sp.]
MKIAMIDFRIGGLVVVCRKGHEVSVFEKNTHPKGISRCLASAKVLLMKYPHNR